MPNFVYCSRQDIDTKQWDTLIESSPQLIIYAFSWYLDAISPKWQAIILLNQDNEYEALMPIPVQYKYGLQYVQQPYHCQQLGIFHRFGHVSVDLMQGFLEKLYKKYNWVVRYAFNEKNPIVESSFSVIRYNQILNLNKPYQQIHKSYKTERRANLKEQSYLVFEKNENFDALIDLHRQHNEQNYLKTGEKINKKWLLRLQNLYKILVEKNALELFFAKNEQGGSEAGILFLYDKHRIIYFYNGATLFGRKTHARLQMLDALFQKYANQDLIFDFESPIDAPKVDTYYGSFGAKPAPYLEVSYNNLPNWLNYLRLLKKKLNRWKRIMSCNNLIFLTTIDLRLMTIS